MEKEKKIYVPKLVQRAGVWIVEYYDHNGKRIRIKKGLNNVNDNEREKNALKLFGEIAAMQPPAPAPTPNEESKIILDLRQWVENERPKWRNKTYLDNRCKINVFINWLKPKGDFVTLNENLLVEFCTYLKKERRLGNTTYNIYRNLLLNALKSLVGKGFDLMDNIKREKECKRGYLYFQDNQIAAIKKACEKENALWFAIQLMFHCFLRPGEIRQLKWENVNFTEKVITIPYHISKNKTTNVSKIPDALFSYMEKFKGYAINSYIVSRDMQESFQMIPKSWLINRHQNILRTLGINTQIHKLYSWRHTAALKNLLAGVPLPVLSKKMRHHSISMTEIYLKDAGLSDYLNLCNIFPEL